MLDRVVASTLPYVPKAIVHKVARRYIAGETADDALTVAARLNTTGIRATMDVLGEDIHNLDQARHAAAQYRDLLEQISRRKVNSNVSIKLTQFGLKVDKSACLDLVSALVSQARELGNFVRIDMEDSSCTTDTLQIYRELRRGFDNVGVVIQAYLRRTLSDVVALDSLRPNFRLCKGVYVESRRVAYRDMRVINRNYVTILDHLLKNGSFVGIATHDELIVWEAMRIIRELNLSPDAYEFQMLLGVEEELRDIIRSQGHSLRVYIPFGKDWYKYSVRRLKENPKLAGYVMNALLKNRRVVRA